MEQEKTPNWMKYPPLLQFYRQVQAAGVELEPDPDFLKDPKLGRYGEYQLKHLEIPQNIKDFLMQVGLPDQFLDFRSPDEENDYKKDVYPGVIFWVSCLRIETIKRKKYLVIGEYRSLNRACIISNANTPDETKKWEKSEESSPVVVELKTGTVWQWIHYYSEDEFTFINSSLEQYLLSMAYWQAFYPGFSKHVLDYLNKHPEKSELDYIFRNDKRLYNSFRSCLRVLDPDVLRKRMTYWKLMGDVALY